MPSNFTENYKLSQWERTDKVQMEDFNTDNAKIDGALAETKTAREALEGRVNGKAEQSALNAEVEARRTLEQTLTAALALRGNCQIGHFTYTGNYQPGENALVINFPHPPLFFFVLGQEGLAAGSYHYNRFITVFGTSPYASFGTLPLTWRGTSANVTTYDTANHMNYGTIYHVIYFYAKD